MIQEVHLALVSPYFHFKENENLPKDTFDFYVFDIKISTIKLEASIIEELQKNSFGNFNSVIQKFNEANSISYFEEMVSSLQGHVCLSEKNFPLIKDVVFLPNDDFSVREIAKILQTMFIQLPFQLCYYWEVLKEIKKEKGGLLDFEYIMSKEIEGTFILGINFIFSQDTLLQLRLVKVNKVDYCSILVFKMFKFFLENGEEIIHKKILSFFENYQEEKAFENDFPVLKSDYLN